MEMHELKHLFISFLKNNDCYENFRHSFKKELNDYIKRRLTTPNSLIGGFCIWSCTPQGHNYWREINDKWLETIQ